MAITYIFDVNDNGSVKLQKIDNSIKILDKSIHNVDNSTNIFNQSLGKLGTAAAAALGSGIAHGVAKLKDLTKEMVDNYDSAAKLSQNIGITSESVLGLRHAAELSAVGSAEIDKNMQKLSKTMFDAASGNKSAEESFKRLGISVTNTDGSLKKSDKVLMEMADKFKALPPGAARAAAAMDIFGKSGASMVSMLKDGSAGLQKMTDEGAAAAGKAAAVAEAMEKLNDASTKAKAALMGIFAGFVESDLFKANVQALKEVSEYLIKWRKESKEKSENKQKEQLEELAKAAEQYATQLESVERSQRKVISSGGSLEEAAKFSEVSIDGLKTAVNLSNEQRKIYAEFNKEQSKLNRAKEKQKELEGDLRESGASTIAIWEKGLEGMNRSTAVGNGSREVEKEIALREDSLNILKKEIKAEEEAAAQEAKRAIEFAKNEKAKEEAAKAAEAARQKALQMYEAETKRLNDWLSSYEKSKLTESQIAEASYNEQLKNLEELNKRKILSDEAYELKKFSVAMDYDDKEKELMQKYQDEKLKAAEEAKNKEWDLRRIAAKDYSAIADIDPVREKCIVS